MDTALTTINLKKETKMSVLKNNRFTSKMTCFKIQRSAPNAFAHNDRSQTVDHAYPQFSNLNEVDVSAFLAEEKYLCMLTQAIQNYIARTGQRVQVDPKNIRRSAIVLIEDRHTIDDVRRLCDVIERKYGWRTIQIAIHRDEGHFDENGVWHPNVHAHIEFFVLGTDGVNLYKSRDFGPLKMKELQTLAANVLGMRRGINYSAIGQTPRKGLPHQAYRILAQTISQFTAKVENLEKKVAQKGAQIEELKKHINALQNQNDEGLEQAEGQKALRKIFERIRYHIDDI
jgi:putative mobilization protein